ncbi:GDSL-type esterase/lipase family protein [Nocardioides sp. GY 10127]|uniref:GDSL-type esterase/lipase family protein n=1 Tax=Nocardioides sp. GY 10127 TaxID=2569762 RepID=UPI001458B6B7|nr:GDSL-type esterase/lipase family protein [Nocardioides sp. GY 10127]
MPLSDLSGRLPTPSRRLGVLLGVLALLVAGLAVGADVWGGAATGSRPSRCAVYATDSTARAATVTGQGSDVLVVGDSWSAGLGLADPATSWPSQLPGRVHVAAFSGSGWSSGASACGPRFSFPARLTDALLGVAPEAPVVVAGGLNDYDMSDAAVAAGFARVVRTLTATDHPFVVVGPAPAPSRLAGAERVDALLARLAADAGVTYVSVIDVDDLDYLDDDLHLQAASHVRFGRLIARRIAGAGVALG